MVRFEVLGSTRLVDEETGKAYTLGSGGHLLAYLMLHAPDRVDRRKCAMDLYPEDEYDISGNRLRVAIVRFKKILGAALIAGGSDLALDVSAISIDFINLKQQIQSVSDLVDVSDELDALTGLIPQLGKRLLPDISDVWVRRWQDEWRDESMRLLKRLALLASNAGNWQVVADAMQVALKNNLNDVELWRTYLRALVGIGDVDRGTREFNRATKTEDFNLGKSEIDDIKQYARELKSGELDVTNRWTDIQLINLGRLLARAIEDSPKDAASFFLARGALGEFYRDPSAFLPFLYALIEQDDVVDEIEQDIRLRIMDAEGLRYAWQEVLKQTDYLLAQEMDQDRRARVYFGRSFAYFQGRDFESAVAMIQESAEIYEQLNDKARSMNSRAVEASYWWHLGEYQKALSMYADSRISLIAQDTPLSRANAAISWANTTTVYVILGDWKNALLATEECFVAMGNEPNENMLAMFNTVAGLVYVVAGELHKGIDLLVDGLKRSYRRGSSREQQIGLEWAAGALLYGGCTVEANAVMSWVDDWRNQTQHARSIAEKHYADRIKSESGRIKPMKLDPDEDSKRVIGFVISLLRKSEARRGVA